MAEFFSTLAQLLLAVLGAATTPDSWVVGLALAVVAVALAAVIAARSAAARGESTAPHPQRAIDESTLLPQSHPDAGGHPRPRAPGVVPAA